MNNVPSSDSAVHMRWLGRVSYDEALALQLALANSPNGTQHVLMLEHPHTFTGGVRARPEHLLVEPESVGAVYREVARGGDVTYHGPGQLVAYPVVTVPGGGVTQTARVTHALESWVMAALSACGVGGLSTDPKYPGVWADDGNSGSGGKLAAVGVRILGRRTTHGIAINVDPDLEWFSRIVPCGITDRPVTSLRELGYDVSMTAVVDALCETFTTTPFARLITDDTGKARSLRRADVTSHRSPTAFDHSTPEKPPWMRANVEITPEYRSLHATMRARGLVTVCEEAGCPNIFECWKEGTATFMINGERCTRACGFCLIDTRRPKPLDPTEPDRVAAAAEKMGLRYVVITEVARDDLPDGGAGAVAATIRAVRDRLPGCGVEVLISDCKGDADSLGLIFDATPDVLNHNLETVARLQREVRPSAGYARSLGVLARAGDAGLVTKSGLMVGLGETHDEMVEAMVDLRSVGVSILTIGQYLQPSERHLSVHRWWTPDEFADLRRIALDLGFSQVQASPLTRSSYRAHSLHQV